MTKKYKTIRKGIMAIQEFYQIQMFSMIVQAAQQVTATAMVEASDLE
jgi:hypothetical protein